MFSMNVGANYANHRSKEESTSQPSHRLRILTARAMDRIVTKVHEERSRKSLMSSRKTILMVLITEKGIKMW
jgi:hypothetical protein